MAVAEYDLEDVGDGAHGGVRSVLVTICIKS